MGVRTEDAGNKNLAAGLHCSARLTQGCSLCLYHGIWTVDLCVADVRPDALLIAGMHRHQHRTPSGMHINIHKIICSPLMMPLHSLSSRRFSQLPNPSLSACSLQAISSPELAGALMASSSILARDSALSGHSSLWDCMAGSVVGSPPHSTAFDCKSHNR